MSKQTTYYIGDHVLVKSDNRWVYGFILGFALNPLEDNDYLIGFRLFEDRAKENYKGYFQDYKEVVEIHNNLYNIIYEDYFPKGIIETTTRNSGGLKPLDVKSLLVKISNSNYE